MIVEKPEPSPRQARRPDERPLRSASRDRCLSFVERLHASKDSKTDFGLQELTARAVPMPRLSSGSLLLDSALGGDAANGFGYGKGRIVELYGAEGAGKTTLLIHAMKEAQSSGRACGFIDAEHAFDPVYAEAVGVDLGSLLVAQPDSAEEALDLYVRMAESGDFELIGLDSVAALAPRAELEGEVGQSHVGLVARLMGQALRKSALHLRRHQTTAIFLNQLRESIGVLYGSRERQPGGRALKFYASQRLDIRRIGSEKVDGRLVSNRVRIKVVKNKTAPPYREAETTIVYGKGIDLASETLDLALEQDILSRSGSWYAYAARDGSEPRKLAQGRSAVLQVLSDDLALFDELHARVIGLDN